jgi:glycosyltransferase involved in cell wall biosynthesis
MAEETKAKRKLKIICNTNAQWATSGYANIVKQLYPRMLNAGFQVASVNFYGQEGGIFELDGIKQYPKMASVWGDDALVHHSNDFKADISLTMQDIWTMDFAALKALSRFVPVVPIDHTPTPPAVYERLKLAYRIITYSKFGYDQLQAEGLYSNYIPLTVETNIFKPLGDKGKYKTEIGIPADSFVFGMVAANKDNPPRKSFQEAMDAFMMFIKKVPNAVMYFHTFLNQTGGFPIDQYANFLGIREKVYFLQPYDLMYHVDRETLAKIYNAMDVLLAPSTNEGFGIPIIEAQACGVPAITTRWTSMPELVKEGVTGYSVDLKGKWYTPMLAYSAYPSTDSIYDSMMRIWNKDRVKMGEEARKFMLEDYDADKIFTEKWMPWLDKVEAEIYG